MGFFFNAADRIKVRDQRKSVHRHGTVLGPLADWPTEGNATRSRGQCLAEVRHGGVRNPVGLGRHFLHEHVGSASTWISSRMKTLREHSYCGEISGERGAQGKEMRSSNRPTRYLSSAELLGVLDSAEAPKSPACLFRDTLRGVAAQRRPEKVLMCQKLQRSLHSGCAVCALDAFKKRTRCWP